MLVGGGGEQLVLVGGGEQLVLVGGGEQLVLVGGEQLVLDGQVPEVTLSLHGQ